MSETKTKARRLRELLRDARPVVSPGIYDGYSARLVQKMGFKTAATTGAGLTNSLIVQPDIGIFGLRDNVDACRHLARSIARSRGWVKKLFLTRTYLRLQLKQ